jgi:hypothetical protein
MATLTNGFQVGDIVVIKSIRDNKLHRAFIEEIIRDPNYPQRSLWDKGKYSLYGLEQIAFRHDEPSIGDWYYGDHLEDELGATGESMTIERLQEYRKNLVSQKGDGFAKDIDVVIKNLGRSSGRNIR